MLITSHNRGELSWALNKTLNSRSGRPRSMIGWIAPKPMTSTVMSSAERVIDRRHSALLTRRIAEISVPA